MWLFHFYIHLIFINVVRANTSLHTPEDSDSEIEMERYTTFPLAIKHGNGKSKSDGFNGKVIYKCMMSIAVFDCAGQPKQLSGRRSSRISALSVLQVVAPDLSGWCILPNSVRPLAFKYLCICACIYLFISLFNMCAYFCFFCCIWLQIG